MRRGETAKFMLRVNNMRELFAAFAHFAVQLAAKCAARLTQALCIERGYIHALLNFKCVSSCSMSECARRAKKDACVTHEYLELGFGLQSFKSEMLRTYGVCIWLFKS